MEKKAQYCNMESIDIFTMALISNHAMLYRHDNVNELYELSYNFQGTLLYVTIHIDSFVEEEIMDTFTF